MFWKTDDTSARLWCYPNIHQKDTCIRVFLDGRRVIKTCWFVFFFSSPQKFPQLCCHQMGDTKVLKTAEMLLKIWLRDLEFPNLCSYCLCVLGSKVVSGTTSFFCFLSAKHTAILVMSFRRNWVENGIYLECVLFFKKNFREEVNYFS